MMKVMISQPMNGRKNIEIKQERQEIIEKFKKMHIEVVDTLFDYEITDENINAGIYYLADSLKELSKVDALYCTDGWEKSRGCRIENEVAKEYGIKVLYSDFFENENKILTR